MRSWQRSREAGGAGEAHRAAMQQPTAARQHGSMGTPTATAAHLPPLVSGILRGGSKAAGRQVKIPASCPMPLALTIQAQPLAGRASAAPSELRTHTSPAHSPHLRLPCPTACSLPSQACPAVSRPAAARPPPPPLPRAPKPAPAPSRQTSSSFLPAGRPLQGAPCTAQGGAGGRVGSRVARPPGCGRAWSTTLGPLQSKVLRGQQVCAFALRLLTDSGPHQPAQLAPSCRH